MKRSPCSRIRHVELFFSCVAEGRVADVVDQGQGFGEIGIQAQAPATVRAILRDFKRVREAIAEMVGVARGEDLRLRFEAAKGAGMDDAVAVARVIVAIGMRRFREAPAARAFDVHGVGSGHSAMPF